MNIITEDIIPLTERLKNSKDPVVLYGMGNGADKIIDLCSSNGIKISGVFASDGFAKNKLFHGMPVRTYAATKEALGEPLTVLLSFATSRPDVLENIRRIAAENTLLAPDVPAFGNTVFDLSFFYENYGSFEAVCDMLADERSATLYEDVIKYKLTGEIKYLEVADSEEEYMENILCSSEIKTFADAGAYRGDTARRQMLYSNCLEKIIAVEPDPKTYRKLCAEFENETSIEFIAHNVGLYSKDAEFYFLGDGGRGGSAAVIGGEKKVRFMPLDDIVGDEKIDYVKYDVEGFEYEALLGSVKLIKRSQPRMLVSLYHRSEDLFKLPLLVKRLYPDCKMYLRRLAGIPAWDLNLLVVPPENNL